MKSHAPDSATPLGKMAESKIYFIRKNRVMLSFDLANLYQVPTKVFTQAIKRNLTRFPSDFMFQLTPEEWTNLRSQFVTSSSDWGGIRYLPFAFTEQGIAMLSSVLNSEQAIQVNVEIIRTFVRLREIISSHRDLEKKLEALECKYDGKFKAIFEAIRQIMNPCSGPKRKIGIR